MGVFVRRSNWSLVLLVVLMEQRQVWWPPLVLTTTKVGGDAAVHRAHPTGQDRSSTELSPHARPTWEDSDPEQAVAVALRPPRHHGQSVISVAWPLPTDTLSLCARCLDPSVDRLGFSRWCTTSMPVSQSLRRTCFYAKKRQVISLSFYVVFLASSLLLNLHDAFPPFELSREIFF